MRWQGGEGKLSKTPALNLKHQPTRTHRISRVGLDVIGARLHARSDGVGADEGKGKGQLAVSKEEALPHGVGNELHPYEREHTKNRDKYQHQHNAEGDYALLSSFASDVPRHCSAM